jgi:hypothetical protein
MFKSRVPVTQGNDMNKHVDDGNNGDFGVPDMPHISADLRQVIEVGRVWIADFTTEYRVFLDCSVVDVQTPGTQPFATLPAGKQSWAVANLMAALISETWPTGTIDLPEWFNDDLKFADEIINDTELGGYGNVGTLSDDINIKILGRDGRPL